MKPNKSVLQCPQCGKALVKIGSKVKRIHPVPRFIDKNYLAIVVTWSVLSVGIILITALGAPPQMVEQGFSVRAVGAGKGIGFAWIALLMLPSAVMYFLVRAFSLWRITDCPYCGFHEEQKLGRSPSL